MTAAKVLALALIVTASLGESSFEERRALLAKTLVDGVDDVSLLWKDSSKRQASRPKYDPKWFTALSKIARIRTADGRSWNAHEEPIMEEEDGQSQKPRKFHCQPVQDIFVPKVGKKLPAYACKLGSRRFVLTSERFLQDRRTQVDVSVDDGTFLRLNQQARKDVASKVIPAELVLNKRTSDYRVKRT